MNIIMAQGTITFLIVCLYSIARSKGSLVIGCSSNLCNNHGTCYRNDGQQGCFCNQGYGGAKCDIDLVNGPCGSNPCENGGNCTRTNDRTYVCQCVAGYSDKNCQTDIDECASRPCLNGGTCLDNINQFLCNCTEGFKGARCETDIDECVSSPCLNNGVCADGVNSFKCACPEGVSGDRCEHDIDECVSSPCLNNGVCADGVNSFKCACPEGISGDRCEHGPKTTTVTVKIYVIIACLVPTFPIGLGVWYCKRGVEKKRSTNQNNTMNIETVAQDNGVEAFDNPCFGRTDSHIYLSIISDDMEPDTEQQQLDTGYVCMDPIPNDGYVCMNSNPDDGYLTSIPNNEYITPTYMYM